MHERLTHIPLPNRSETYEDRDILDTLLKEGIPKQLAISITKFILQKPNWRPKGGIRCSTVYPIRNVNFFWIVLEWKEHDDANNLAIFHITDELQSSTIPSWLMHRGDSEGCTTSTISWSVLKFYDLKYLFQAVQHILGILELSTADALKLYCEPNPNERSNEAYVFPFPPLLNK